MKNNLAAKQKKFADLYIETGDKQKSYLKAYPTAKPGSAAAAATRLLKNVKVKAYIDTRQEQIDSEVFKHQIVTKERILQEEGARIIVVLSHLSWFYICLNYRAFKLLV